MNEQNEILDSDLIEKSNASDEHNIISVNKFIFLSIISFGLYEVWWTYKAWRYFKQKEDLDIMPVARAIFSLFYLTSLFNKILHSAQEKEYTESYSSVSLFVGYFILSGVSRLPDPFWLASILNFIFFIGPFKALNFVKLNSTEPAAVEQDSFSTKQIVLIVLGSLLWVLVILGFIKGD